MTEAGLGVRGITKRFGSLVAVNNLAFDVRPGEVFGFVGSNGAGKTTTMRIVMGVLEPDAGEVHWGGAPITFDVRRSTGYMPEERGLYPRMKIGDQLTFFGQLHGLSSPDAMAASSRWLDRFGLGERAADELQKLSHGNQQRVQLAAALVFKPQLLVLDEPFAGLDPEAVDAMSEVLHEQAAAGTPVIFSSHQLEVVERLCDRVCIIRRGELVALGTVSELRGHGPERYWVDAPAAAQGWTANLPGVKIAGSQGSRLLLELHDGTNDQALLQAALATGPVREFHRDEPTLLDLFREYVSEQRGNAD
ncbi:MAG TPA: ATP-binding cassette domain-containing protein [Candidatus Dormibacteraeota bacterium]